MRRLLTRGREQNSKPDPAVRPQCQPGRVAAGGRTGDGDGVGVLWWGSPAVHAFSPVGNVVHLVSAGGQHHIISQPAQVALIQAMTQQGGQAQGGVQAMSGPQPTTILPAPASATTAATTSAAISVPIAATQGECQWLGADQGERQAGLLGSIPTSGSGAELVG